MNEVRTTFVPRRPTLATPQVTASRGPDFVALAATFIFVVSALAAGGVYAWRWNLGRQIEGQAAQLEKARDSFDKNFVEQASLLNDRIVAANKILDEHLAPTELLDVFEQFTLRTIAFQSFTAVHQADGAVAITAVGVGKNFESVVLQSDWFGEGPEGDGARLRDVVFSRLGENDRKEATFNFAATIPAERILFSRSITQMPAPAAPQPIQRTIVPSPASSTAPAAAPSSTPAVPPPGARTAPPGSITI
jgi:cell division protein FtsB